MKLSVNRKFTLLLFVFITGITLSGCDLSVEDDNPTPEEQLKNTLPQVQYHISYWTGSDIARYQLIWMQQQAGIRGSHLQVDKYNMSHSYLDTQWAFFYNNVFLGCQNMMVLADEANSPAYRGISRILQAYSLGFMTDTWGDVPYQYGLSYFSGIVPPTYDPQNEIYVSIIDLLLRGIDDLTNAMNEEGLKPTAEDDIIYQGDLLKWRRAANVMQMRYLLRMANVSGEYGTIAALAESSHVFNGVMDDMIFNFDASLGINNPHFYNDNTVKNTRMGKFIVDKLTETNDPRLPVYVKKNSSNVYLGTSPGEGLVNASFIGSQLASASSPLPLITYTEQKFIEAEVSYRLQQYALADQAFEQAVKSSLLYHNVTDAQWEAVHAEVENVSLEQIINAKYIALFLHAEVWSDYRRTGFPQLIPYQESAITEIPRHFVYPSDEILNNVNNVPDNIDIYSRMWWDQEDQQD